MKSVQECLGTKDFNVAIIGGGMVGIVAAIGLSRAGINVDMYEAKVSALCPLFCAIVTYIFESRASARSGPGLV
jgi:2-polyprenyl-6-methoxyphenol hydroxylase-like FAD-dependent oxidoreductase